MNRRKFLASLALAAAGPSLFGAASPGSTAGRKGKVIVIGAGIAGIAAARELRRYGYEVLVLEGQRRIGGRIWTDRSFGTPIDLGASWIHGIYGNPIYDLVRKFGISSRATRFERVHLYNYDGRKRTDTEFEEIWSGADYVFQQALDYSENQENDVSFQTAIDVVLKREKLTQQQLYDLGWRIAGAELNSAIEFEKLSTWYGAEGGFSGEDVLFPGGYDQLIHRLAEGMDIRSGKTVRHIAHNNSGVKVQTGSESFDADFALITVPLGVLKKESISFDRPLPASKRQAIREMGMGVLNKIAITFENTFWQKDRDFIGYVSKTKGEFPVFVNWAYYTGKPALLATIPNKFSRTLESLDDRVIKGKIDKLMAKLYPNAGPAKAIKFARWASHPYSYGSYSYMPVGVTNKVYDELARPSGKLFFAGEHTSGSYAGTVHGAYLSGIREAERIANL